jgi:hypothetical protein
MFDYNNESILTSKWFAISQWTSLTLCVLKIALELFYGQFRYRTGNGMIFRNNVLAINRELELKSKKIIKIKTTIIIGCDIFALLVILLQFHYLIVIYCVVLLVKASQPILIFFEQNNYFVLSGKTFLFHVLIISRFIFLFFVVIHEILIEIKSNGEKTILHDIYLFANSRPQLSTALISIVISAPLLVWIYKNSKIKIPVLRMQ